MTARFPRAALALLALLIGLSLAPIAHAEGALYVPATGNHLDDDQGFLG
jgi:hypothetical protein